MKKTGKLIPLILNLSMLTVLQVYGCIDTLPLTQMGRRHYELARQTELESMVLLENRDHTLPLEKTAQRKIAVFGNGSLMPTKGSSGSGTVSGAFTYNLYDGLKEIGVAYDETVYHHYQENITVNHDWGVVESVNHHWDTSDKEKWGQARFSNTGWNQTSPIAMPELDLEDRMVAAAADFSSDRTAVVYITRGVGTEEMDRFDQPSDWYLNPSEYTLLKQVTREFDQVIIILNTSGSIDLSWMDFDWLADDPAYNEGGSVTREFAKACGNKIKGLILSYGSGSYHGLVVAELLYGEEDFSGKLADSMTKTYRQQPTKDNFHYVTYADKGLNDQDFNALNGQNDPIYLYQEDIFTGYRYFDTFAADDVLYPFGNGLSYNTYAFGNYQVEASEVTNTITVSATLSNVSTDKTLPAGKEVLEIYVSAPEGELEQPYQKLLAYAKTGKLAPGASETVAVSIPVADLASYHEGKAAYVLEAGDYIIRAGNSSRDTHIAGILTVEETIIAEQLSNRLTLNGADPTGKADNKAVYDAMRFSTKGRRPADPAVAGYQNPNDPEEIKEAKASALLIDGRYVEFKDNSDNNISFISGLAPRDQVATLTAVSKGEISLSDFVVQMTKDELVNFLSGGYGARNSDQYYSDDPALQINHLTSKDAGKGWIGGAGSSRNIRRLGIPSLTYADGSAGIFIGAANAEKLGIDPNPGFARAAGMACTWNPELQYQWGKAIGEEMRAINVDIWLAPSINLHRNPLNGRNTEYYSEDPVLSGQIAAFVARGVAENGLSVCLKHFAGNDQEWYRRGLHTQASAARGENKDAANTIVSERALREVTLKPFEIAVKSGQVRCVMSAFNKINGKYCAASDELLTDILRGEWGFEGFVVTDWGDFDEIAHAADEMRAGNDMIMSGYHTRYKIPDQIYQNVVDSYTGQPHTVSLTQLRRNAANVLTTILSSRNAFKEDGDYNQEKHVQNRLEILTTQLPVAIVGMDYANIKVNPVLASGSEGTMAYTFSLAETSDALPASLILHGNGMITGVPAPEALGQYDLLVRVEDDQGNTATRPLELKVANLGIVTTALPVARLEMDYATQFAGFAVTGGKAPVVFELAKGNLPEGLQLQNDGRITGVPREKGDYPFVVKITDQEGHLVEESFVLKVEDIITVSFAPESPLTDVEVGNNIFIGISAGRNGFNDAYEYQLLDAPEWLSLHWNFWGANMTGIPSGPGTYRFKVQVKVTGSAVMREVPYVITVKESRSGALAITTAGLPDGTVNVPYTQAISISGGQGQKSFVLAEDSDHPEGLTLTTDGILTWTPAGQDYGFYNIKIKVKDQENNEATKAFRLYITGGLQVDPPNHSELKATIGKAFSRQVTASGGTVASFNFSLSPKGDALPKGLTFRNGMLSGQPGPDTAGEYFIVIRVSENGGSFSGAEVRYRLMVTE